MNYILFYPDEMRAEGLSCYGNNFVDTPNYDRLAQSGTLFENCFVENPVCSPSRICMMTGKYPHNDGHRTLWNLLQPYEPSLFEYLKDSGFQVIWYGKNDLYSEESLSKCADVYHNCKGGHNGKDIYQFGEDGYYGFLKQACASVEGTSDYRNVEKAIEFVRNWKVGDKPFFMYLPLSMPHPVYSAPEPYYSMYDGCDIKLKEPKQAEVPSFYHLQPQYRNLDKMDEGFFKKINKVYHGMISYMDMLMGRLLAELDNSNAAANTTFIATSDHGDFAGDYNMVEKWPNCFDDCLCRVPLVIRTPNGKRNKRVTEQVESFDIFATVMDLENIACKHTHYAHSLKDILLTDAKGDKDRLVFAEGGYNVNEPNCFEGYSKRVSPDDIKSSPKHIYYPKFRQQQEQPQSVCRATMVRSPEYKLVYRPNEVSELYDLVNDKDERNNLYDQPQYQQIKNQLQMSMLKWYSDTSDSVRIEEDQRGFPEEQSKNE